MKMYVGNATKQHFDFAYRMPGETKRIRQQRIEIGQQTQLSGELTQEEIDYIIQQHNPYGFAAASEIDHITEPMSLCYSVGKPISVVQLQKLMFQNENHLITLGRKLRLDAAVAGNEQLQQVVNESGRNETLRAMEASIMEDNHDDRDQQEPVSEGYRIIRNDSERGGRPTTRRARRKAA